MHEPSPAGATTRRTRRGLALAVTGALGELADRKLATVAWSGGSHAGGEAIVALSGELRRDARRLFGRTHGLHQTMVFYSNQELV